MNGLIAPSCLLKGALGSQDRIFLADAEPSFAEKPWASESSCIKYNYLKTNLSQNHTGRRDTGKLGGC